MKIAKRVEERMVRVGELLAQGQDCITKAANIYVSIIDENPSYKELLQSKYTNFPKSLWSRLELVGRKQLTPLLIADCGLYVNKLKNLPLPDQEKALKEGVEILVDDGNDKMKVNPANASREQLEQMFAYDHIRDEAEQRAWIKSRSKLAEKVRKKTEAKKETMDDIAPYEVKGGKLVIKKPCTLNAIDLSYILAEVMKCKTS